MFVHRDPVAVLASVARLTEVLRRPFTRRVDRLDIGREDSDRWLTAAELMIAAADQERFAKPIFHVHYPELVADPVGTVAALYRHFGRVLDPDAAARIRRRVAANPNGGYARRRARLEDYGLDPAREHERYARYMARFGIRPEQGERSSAGPGPGPRSPPPDRRFRRNSRATAARSAAAAVRAVVADRAGGRGYSVLAAPPAAPG